ncbi:hypothetical protein [Amphibacillus indicireducens]|uniref:hypothetical protein n=1 Tax=Amphibacillus indicireducens TaxID=1076330 RepID=UPI0031EEACFF
MISKFPELLEDEIELECLRELEKRAQVTHTQNNLMLVPYGYNSARGFRLKTYKSNQKIQDRLDLTIVDLKEMLEDLELGDIVIQKRLNNNKSTLDSVKFLLDNKNILIPQIPLYTDKYKLNSIEGILENSKAINETLW